MAKRGRQAGLDDLFSAAVSADERLAWGVYEWPDAARFPVNEAGRQVGSTVVADLAGSAAPLVVAGYSSIGELIELIARWARRNTGADQRLRVLLGTEPFARASVRFGDVRTAFTDEVNRFWLEERGLSILQSASLVAALEQLRQGRVEARFLQRPGAGLHAKIYVGDQAATVGSSNFTTAGLRTQLEANARFDRDVERDRFDQLRQIAENYWSAGSGWDAELVALLESLLAVVGWREALARACAELLDGVWADRYLTDVAAGVDSALWPSQRAGIAQALWIIERVGSVLVADATGSGKTRMGAHLVRAIRDRLWATGRVRTDRNALVCPPAVIDTWEHEIHQCGLAIQTVSHGKLSRSGRNGERSSREELLVADTQVLAVDEAHHYLNPAATRTQQIRGTQADHVALFTATPINRGSSDLLQLVALLSMSTPP